MNDSMFFPPIPDSTPLADEPSAEKIPQFGALDIVEAFTAMRHEYRGQTKESRALAEQLEQAVASIQAWEAKRLAATADKQSAPDARQLALLVVETDHQLSRAVTAIAQWEEQRRERTEASQRAVQEQITALGSLGRWFARPLIALLEGQRTAQTPAGENPALEGLNMVLSRLRRTMRDHGIERLDVQGQPFDAETMHAIGTVASSAHPPGSVAEQLSPTYRWQGQVLRFADVRVAAQESQH